jgi:hypothetical protein
MQVRSSFGPFHRYDPPSDDTMRAGLAAAGALFARTPTGDDWYDIVHGLPSGDVYALCRAGHVISVARDPTSFGVHDNAILVAASSGVEIGWSFDGTTLSPPQEALPPTIDEAKLSAKRTINAGAETARLRYITPGDGMAAVYRDKLDQAEDVLAQGQAAASTMDLEAMVRNYPMLAASVGIEADTIWQVANTIVARHRTWSDVSAKIETRRLIARRAIDQATTHEAVASVLSAITWDDL